MTKEYITSTNKDSVRSEVDSSGSLEKVEFYGTGGKINENEKECYAKSKVFVNQEGQERMSYHVKSGRNGSLFNPWGMYSEGTESKSFGGELYWKFKPVNKRCFDFYLKFLESRNNSWILNAEREIK